MKYFVVVLSLLGSLFLSACAEDGKYPVSGEECTQSDPVQEMSVPDCAPTTVSS